MTFRETLAEQRWDDHRYYHHSRINQSLHLVSALAFLSAYGLMFMRPGVASLIGWLIAMPSRQIGHFFFEPKGYDAANQASHEEKEAIKVGYNLRRKIILLSIWIVSPLLLAVDPTLWGLLTPRAGVMGVLENISLMWLAIGIGAVVFRSIQLFVLRDVQAGMVWAVKILTDPFHDVKIYYRSPLHLMRGELYDPIVPTATAAADNEPVPSLAAPVA